MAIATNRGAIRVGRRTNSNLLLKPAKSRKGLLLGSSFAGGALMVLGATLMMPSAAQAACAVTEAGKTFVCTGTGGSAETTPQTFTATTSNWLTSVGIFVDEGAPPTPTEHAGEIAGPAGVPLTINAGGYSGNFYVSENSSIYNASGSGTRHAVVINPGAAGGSTTIGMVVDGTIDATNDSGADALRVPTGSGSNATGANNAYNLNLTVGEGGEIKGNDDGFVVTGLTGQLNVYNHGLISGAGVSGSGANKSEGITILQNGQEGAAVDGDVYIENWGTISGAATGVAGSGIQSSASGSTHVINHGHIDGGVNAANFANSGSVYVENFSYQSMIGDVNGPTFSGTDWVQLDNESGLYAGLTGDGININDVTNTAFNHHAILINNFPQGVTVGANNGIYIDGVSGTAEGDANTFINNQATFTVDIYNVIHWTPGGLIAGMRTDGIGVYNSEGDVTVDNRFTQIGTIAFSGLDSDVYGSEGDLLGMSGSPTLPSSTFTTGIFGMESGINGSNIDGTVTVWNRAGQIVGEGDNGIGLTNIGGGVLVDNTAGYAEESEGGHWVGGGTIWGGEDGVYLSGVTGDLNGPDFGPFWQDNNAVVVYNDGGGKIFGLDSGISVDAAEGGVAITNFGGRIEGWGEFGAGQGIHVQSDSMVGIYQGFGDLMGPTGSESSDGRGWIIGDSSAIDVDGHAAFIWSSRGGVVVGDGSEGDAVIRVNTDSFASVNGSMLPFGIASGAGAFISNGGLMTSWNNPQFEWGDDPATNEFPNDTIDFNQLATDVSNYSDFAWSGGASGSTSDLNTYRQTASDLLIQSESGATMVFNGDPIDFFFGESGVGPLQNALMFGRVDLTGHTFIDPSEGGSYDTGSNLINFGKWFTTNIDSESGVTPNPLNGNVLTNSEGGSTGIYNLGVIQTAFGSESGGGDVTSFKVDDFFNGGSSRNDFFGEGDGTFSGLLSMTDGSADDRTYIFGNFHGADPGFADKSYLGVDVYFASPTEGGASDILQIGDVSESDWVTVTGSTGIIANKLNSSTDPSTEIGDRIPVVYAFTNSDGACMDAWCKEGDEFFVSELSPNYVNVGGIGFIRDGMFMWGLQQKELGPDPETDWVATWGPDAHDQPVLVSTLQTAWYDTSGYVEDHVYGNTYPETGSGGAGADLPSADTSVAPPTTRSAQQSSLWGRISGNWSTRDSTVEQIVPPATFDTSLSQQTYNITAGLEFRPDGGDSDMRFGVFGGYVSSNVSFDSYGATSKSSGGLVGGYAAWIKGPWYIDAEVKADFLGVSYTSPTVSASTNALSIGVLANTGYRMDNGRTFIEPIASFGFVNTSLGDTSGGGATITYSNGQSIKAGIGARVGATFGAVGSNQTELDVLGKVWDEFGAPNQVTVSDGVNTTTFTDNIAGITGEVVGRATIYNADRSASGFVSVGGKFGAGSTNVTAKAGLRKNF